LWGLAYFGTKPILFAAVEICWFILSVFKICCKIFFFQTGEKSVGRRKCNKVFTLPSHLSQVPMSVGQIVNFIYITI